MTPTKTISRLFARTSVAYLVASSMGGVYLFIDQNHPAQLRAAHSHLLLIGWVTMGLAAALLRTGDYSVGVARTGWLVSNVGLLSMTAAWVSEAEFFTEGLMPLMAGAGLLELVGLLLMGVAIWQSVAPPREPASLEAPERTGVPEQHDSY